MRTDEEYEAARREHARREAKDRRDRFAMAALTGLIASRRSFYGVLDAARTASEYADALIAELDKGK